MQHAESGCFRKHALPFVRRQLRALRIADRVRAIGTMERTLIGQLRQQSVGPEVHDFTTMRLRANKSVRHSTASVRRVASSISYSSLSAVTISRTLALPLQCRT